VNRLTYYFFILFCLFTINNSFSQVETILLDTTNVDTIKVHSVKKAAIYSAALPGLGQIYNHRAMPKGKKKAFWKVPLIYAGLGATTYFALKNNSDQKNLKEEYRYRIDNNTSLYSEFEAYDKQGLLTLYDQKVRRRDLFYIGLGFVYLLQVADAAVEAHFVRFDVSDNLTMQVYPKLISTHQIGVGIKLNFR
jgi:hypothetical protein